MPPEITKIEPYGPPRVDPQARIAALRKLLETAQLPNGQRNDVEEALRLYESGEFDGCGVVHIQNERRVNPAELNLRYPVFVDVRAESPFSFIPIPFRLWVLSRVSLISSNL